MLSLALLLSAIGGAYAHDPQRARKLASSNCIACKHRWLSHFTENLRLASPVVYRLAMRGDCCALAACILQAFPRLTRTARIAYGDAVA